MISDTKDIGEKIRQRREYLGLLQRDVAEKLSMSQANYGKIESGKVGISAADLTIVADVLRAPIGYFYGEDTDAANSDSWDVVLNASSREAGFDGSDMDESDRAEWREVVKSVTAGLVRAKKGRRAA